MKARGQTRKRGGATENKVGLVLGITSAEGHTRNVLSKASEISKNVRSNYLTNTLRRKRFEQKKNAFFKNYNEERYKSKLHYAIQKHEPYAVKLVLPTSSLRVRMFNMTPLENAFAQLRFNLVKEEDLPNAVEIVEILLRAKAPVNLACIENLWSISSDTILNQLLNDHQILQEKTLEFREDVLDLFEIELSDIDTEMISEQYEFRRGENGGYGYIPQNIYDKRSDVIEKIERLLEFRIISNE